MKISLWIYFREGISAILSMQLRSFLAAFGILAGVASVVAVISCGKMATRESLRQFEKMGIDFMSVTALPKDNDSGKNSEILSQAEENIKNADRAILEENAYAVLYYPIQYLNTTIPGSIISLNSRMLSTLKILPARGRLITNVDQNNLLCVIGASIAKNISKITLQNPVGKQIRLGESTFTIVGVLGNMPENMFLDFDMNNAVLIPKSTETAIGSPISFDHILLKISPDSNINRTQQNIQNWFSKVTHMNSYIRTSREILAGRNQQSKILMTFLGVVGGVSLLIGAVSVMNIMLISVLERRREIGIRISLGATSMNICCMFLSESILISFLGGIPGVLLGLISSLIISQLWHWEFEIFIFPIVSGLLVTTLAGVLSGILPALRASQMEPVEALRTE